MMMGVSSLALAVLGFTARAPMGHRFGVACTPTYRAAPPFASDNVYDEGCIDRMREQVGRLTSEPDAAEEGGEKRSGGNLVPPRRPTTSTC